MTRSVMQHKTAFDEFLIGFKVEQKQIRHAFDKLLTGFKVKQKALSDSLSFVCRAVAHPLSASMASTV